MNPKRPLSDIAHPWILGSFAVYANNIHVARRVYEYARSQANHVPYGTMVLETGETIDWINMNYGVVRQEQSE